VALDGEGNCYVASWGANAVHRFEPTFAETPELVLSGLSKPADIYYNLQTDTLAVPNSGNNTVSFAFLGVEPPSATSEELTDFQLVAFPNPVAERLTLTLGEPGIAQAGQFEIVSMDGKRWGLVPAVIEHGQVSFDVAHLPKGNYLLRVSHKSSMDAVRFFKQ
jgi:Secretion system C-terminal sorting domain